MIGGRESLLSIGFNNNIVRVVEENMLNAER
jgi:hypothetical protein